MGTPEQKAITGELNGNEGMGIRDVGGEGMRAEVELGDEEAVRIYNGGHCGS